MKRLTKLTIKWLCLSLLSLTQLHAQQINFPGGRIAFSSDGNQHDKDDWGATALALAIVDAAGLNSKVVHYDYANHLGDNNSGWEAEMVESAEGGAERFGIDGSVFYNDQEALASTVSNLAAEINASSEDDPLWIIAAGPMETVWRGINAAQPDKRQYVTVISHSTWNENHNDTQQLAHNWSDLKSDFSSDGVFFVESCGDDVSAATLNNPAKLPDQNKTNDDLDFNTVESKWSWLRDSDNPDWQWLFNRNDKNSFDVSDAGMTYFLVTGGPHDGGCKTCGVNEVRSLLENPVPKEKFFVEQNKYLCIEIEETGSELGLWVEKTDVSGYTGESHLEFTGNTINGGDPSSPLEYKLKVNNAGRYRMIIRANKRLDGAASDKCNDGYVKMEGDLSGNSSDEQGRLSVYNKFFGGNASGWGWAQQLDVHDVKYNAEYELKPGIYTFTIAGRSIRWNIDRVVFFDITEHSLDWAKNTGLAPSPIENNSDPQNCNQVHYIAVEDFANTSVSGFAPAYIDNNNACLAINASQYKDQYAAARFTYNGESGIFDFRINTLAETDGESTYKLNINGSEVGTYTNQVTIQDYQKLFHIWKEIVVNTGDYIQVEFNSASNGTVPEGDGFAYSRGRWTDLFMVETGCDFDIQPEQPPLPNTFCLEPVIDGGNGLDSLFQDAYQGNPQIIPGTIWAWKYDVGGEGIAYHDSDAGNAGSDFGNTLRNNEDVDLLDKNADGIPETGWTQPGEWLEYTVIVEEDGMYLVQISAAANAADKTIFLKIDNSYTTCAITLSYSGSLSIYGSCTGFDSIPLTAGKHTISVISQSDQLNLELFQFTKAGEYRLPSGTREIEKEWSVYPNPVSEKLNIKTLSRGTYRISLLDISGKVLYDKMDETITGHLQLETGDLDPGIYILRCIISDQTFSTSFFKTSK